MDRINQLRALVERGLTGNETLPPSERAELFDGAALAFAQLDPDASKTAADTAALLREAERNQLQLFSILRRR